MTLQYEKLEYELNNKNVKENKELKQRNVESKNKQKREIDL